MSSAAVRAVAPLALMALIFVLSSDSTPGPDLPAFTRVIAHFTQFALLAALWFWALLPALGRRAIPVAAAISLLYAISDELHQGFVAGRDSDPFDVLVDSLGIAFALVAIRVRTDRSHRRARRAPAPPA